jgi:hypothetical protein
MSELFAVHEDFGRGEIPEVVVIRDIVTPFANT